MMAIIIGSTFVAIGQTNEFYITDRSSNGYAHESFSAEEVAAAKRAKDSRPAKDDPEGNWGQPLEGFQMSIRFDKPRFTNGEPIVAQVILRNVSDRTLWFPVVAHEGDGSEYSVILSRNGEILPRTDEPKGTNFIDNVKRLHAGSQGMRQSPTGTQWKFTVDISKLFDVSKPGKYIVQLKRKIPKLDGSSEVEVASGQAIFSVGP